MNQWIQAIIVTGIFATLALITRTVSKSGFIGGLIVGVLIYGSLGLRGFLILFAFFVIGSACTRFGYSSKEKKGIAQEEGGARSAKHALAKGAVGVMLAIVHLFFPEADWLIAGFAAAYATAAADTASSEIGQVLGKTPILLTSFKIVKPGTEGAVSLEGTIAGIIGGALIGLLVWIFWPPMGLVGFIAVTLASFVANLLESIIGSTLEGLPLMTNEIVNFINTLIGALIGILIYVSLVS